MLFAHGDKNSVFYLIRALKMFDSVFDLQVNFDKSAIYFGNVRDDVKDERLMFSWFV